MYAIFFFNNRMLDGPNKPSPVHRRPPQQCASQLVYCSRHPSTRKQKTQADLRGPAGSALLGLVLQTRLTPAIEARRWFPGATASRSRGRCHVISRDTSWHTSLLHCGLLSVPTRSLDSGTTAAYHGEFSVFQRACSAQLGPLQWKKSEARV